MPEHGHGGDAGSIYMAAPCMMPSRMAPELSPFICGMKTVLALEWAICERKAAANKTSGNKRKKREHERSAYGLGAPGW